MIDHSQAERETRKIAEGRESLLKEVMTAEKTGRVASLPYQNYLIRQVIEEVAAEIKRDLKAKNGAGAYKKYVRYLGTIDIKVAALRAIQAVLGTLLKEGGADVAQPVWKRAAYLAGQAVYSEYLMVHFKELSPALFNSLVREYGRTMTRDERHVLKAFRAKYHNEGYPVPTWDFGDIEGIGNYILTLLVKYKFLESWSRNETKNGKTRTIRYLVLDEDLRSASLMILDYVADLPRVAGPTIEKPLEWLQESNTGGGYHTPDMQKQLSYAVKGKGVGPVAKQVVDMLNTLQSQEWTINVPVLRAVREISLRKDFGDVVAAYAVDKPEFNEDFTELEKKQWKGLARQWYSDKKVRTIKHLRSQKVFRDALDLAQYDTIWFVYYADSRGRTYVRSSSVSPQGSDLEKGLIQFKQGYPLNDDAAIRWFKIAGANRFGLDKLTLKQREEWVDANADVILATGQSPTDRLEWTEAESPVQYLAWAIEYAEWRQDPQGFLSRIPLGQDGTCNGLQNFSALMCDSVGGAAVNLTAGDAPRDIYTDVAKRVTELLQAMPRSKFRDAWLKHGINRKITKRTTMTLPYGCTRFACAQFINEDYISVVKPPEIKMADYGDAANFLSHVVWQALDDVVVKAREVMLWLQGWAAHAARGGHRVAWVAPSGLHVVSEYDAFTKREVKSVAFKSRLMLSKPTGRQDVKKVMNAVAPNFVHSLDASHLARVVARAGSEGIPLAVIHDDFGTVAQYTERLHQIIREEFVGMYEGNTLLKDMAASTGYEVPPPVVGDLDLREVLSSPYFFA
jgi:DNA-directed RNA polymerase